MADSESDKCNCNLTDTHNNQVEKTPPNTKGCLQNAPILTAAAQALLGKTPDEFSTEVTPREMGATAGLEVVTTRGVSGVKARRLDSDAVPDQTHHLEGARLTRVCRRGLLWSIGQLDGVVHAEVLELDQLPFRHPVVHGDMSGEEEEQVYIQPGRAARVHPARKSSIQPCSFQTNTKTHLIMLS